MLKIESNLKINGMHWGLAFVDGIAYTTNVALAANLLLKGYVVTDQPDQPEAGSSITKQELSPIPQSPVRAEKSEAVAQPEHPVSEHNNSVSTSNSIVSKTTANPAKPKTTKSRKKVVTADAADESGV